MSGDTYESPAHGWTCFHCGETFHVPAQAALHFGAPNAKPGCEMRIAKGEERSLLYALRMAEHQRDELEVRLTCVRLGVCVDADLEAESVERFRAGRGLLAEMAAFHQKEKEAGRS